MSDGSGGNLGSARAEITLDASGFARGIASAQSQLSGFSRATAGIGSSIGAGAASLDDFASRADRMGASFNQVSGTLAIFGGSIAAGLGAAAKEFIGFEASMANVNSIAQLSEDALAQLTDSVNNISTSTARGPTELANGLYDIVSSGFEAADAMNILEAAANAATAGLTTTAVASGAITQVLNAYGLGAEEAERVSNVLFQTVNDGVVKFEQLATQIGDVLPGANALGISIEELGAAYATMTIQNNNAAKSETQIEAIMRAAINPTEDMADALVEYGEASASAIIESRGLGGFIEFLGKASGGSEAELFQLLGTTEAYNGVLQLLTENQGEYNRFLANMKGASEGAGATQKALAEQTKTTAFAIQEAKVAVQQAAQSIGGELAPAITSAAGFIQSLATAFSGLSEQTQSIAVGSIAAAGGIALMAAATAKTIGFAFESAAAFSRLAAVIRNSARAMSLLSFAFSPAGIAVAALAIGIGILINRHRDAGAAARDHAKAMEGLKDTIESVAKFIAQLRLDGLNDAADAIEGLNGEAQNNIAILERVASTTRTADGAAQDYADALKFGTINADELRKRQELITEQLPKMEEALRTGGIETVSLARDFKELNRQLTYGEIGPEAYAAKVLDITTHLDKYKSATKDAADQTGELTAEHIKAAAAADDAAKAQEKFVQQLDETTQAAINAIAGIEDIAPGLDGMQTGFNKAGTSAERALLHMDKVGALDLTGAQRQALKLSEDVLQVDKALARTEGRIQQNADDMSVWAGRIQLVDDTLGTAEDGYAALNKMVAEGRLSQGAANDILEDAIYLRERSVDGLESEQVQQAKQISVLADYVRAHDEANGALDKTSESQKGFLTALQSSSGQTALQTVELLTYLQTLGQIPPEKVTEVLADLGDADPVIKALLADLDLLPPDKNIDITATDGASGPILAVNDAVTGLPDRKVVKVDLEFAQTGDGTDLTGSSLETVQIPVKLGAPDTTAVDTFTPDPKAIPTKLEAPDTAAVDSVTPETVRVATILNAPLADLVENYKPDTVHVPTILDAPDDALVTGYAPTTITIPTQLESPRYAAGSTEQGPGTITVPTVLGTPDATTITTYEPAAIEVPVQLGPVPTTPDVAMAAVQVPIELGDVPEIPTSETPAAITIPITFGDLPDVPTQTVKPVIIPAKYSSPDATFVNAATPATKIIPTEYGTPPALTIPAPAGVTVAIAADATTFDTTLADVISDGVAFDEDTYQTSLSVEDSGFDTALADVISDGVAFDEDTYQASLSAEDLGFDTALAGVISDGVAFDEDTYQTSLSAEDSGWNTALSTVNDEGVAFDEDTYETSLSADNSGAIGAINDAQLAASLFATGVYVATINVDTSAAKAAIAELALLLPSSPAKKGPLSKQPSFDYVSDAFASSMGTMVRQAQRSMGNVADSLNRNLALGVLDDSIGTRRAMDAVKIAAVTGGGSTTQRHTHYHDERTFAPLDSEQYGDLLVSAKEGREAYRNIRERRRYG